MLLQRRFGLEVLSAFLALRADVTFKVKIHLEGLTAFLAYKLEFIVCGEVLDEAGFRREGLTALLASEIVSFIDYLEFFFLFEELDCLEKVLIDNWDDFDRFGLDGWWWILNNCLEHPLNVNLVIFGIPGVECAIFEDSVDLRSVNLVVVLELIVKINDLGLNEIFLLFIEVDLLNLDWLIFYLVDYLKGLKG